MCYIESVHHELLVKRSHIYGFYLSERVQPASKQSLNGFKKYNNLRKQQQQNLKPGSKH